MASETEEPLAGGIRHAQTVRVGDTVRKPSGVWTPAVHALLNHLIERGFPAPKPLGFDEQRREILAFIEGQATIWPWPDFFKRSEAVEHVGRTLRRYHNAVADFVPPEDGVWQDCDHAVPAADEIICHGDFGPYNLIWRGERIVGVVDWEWAHPAPAMHDIAFTAWSIVPLCTNEDARATGFDATPHARERLKAFASGYGDVDPRKLLEAVLATQLQFTDKIEKYGAAGKEPWKTFRDIKLHERNMRDHAWLRANLDMLLRGP
jgi:Ser/Thr protein kinase RdoA (MazF antagonist)